MLKALIEGGGWASARNIALAFLTRDESQLDYYEEIAKRMPGRVLASHGLVKKEGAHYVFDHTKTGYAEDIWNATAGLGVDVVLEMLANINLATDLKLLAKEGRVIIIGNRGEITINPRELMARRASARGFTLWAATEQETREIHAAIAAGLENGTMRPIVGKELPLKDAPQAHRDVLAPGAFGKIVLVP